MITMSVTINLSFEGIPINSTSELPETPCVYRLVISKDNGEEASYIGSTKDLRARTLKHCLYFRNGGHTNQPTAEFVKGETNLAINVRILHIKAQRPLRDRLEEKAIERLSSRGENILNTVNLSHLAVDMVCPESDEVLKSFKSIKEATNWSAARGIYVTRSAIAKSTEDDAYLAAGFKWRRARPPHKPYEFLNNPVDVYNAKTFELVASYDTALDVATEYGIAKQLLQRLLQSIIYSAKGIFITPAGSGRTGYGPRVKYESYSSEGELLGRHYRTSELPQAFERKNPYITNDITYIISGTPRRDWPLYKYEVLNIDSAVMLRTNYKRKVMNYITTAYGVPKSYSRKPLSEIKGDKFTIVFPRKQQTKEK